MKGCIMVVGFGLLVLGGLMEEGVLVFLGACVLLITILVSVIQPFIKSKKCVKEKEGEK